MKPNLTPSRHRWLVAVEFPDGTRIEGTSATDVLERWARVATFAIDPATGRPPVLSITELKELVGRRIGVLEALSAEVRRPGAIHHRTLVVAPAATGDGSDGDLAWLRAGEEAGAWWVIER